MKRVALVIGDKVKRQVVPRGTVLVAIKRFKEIGGKLTGPYSYSTYTTPIGKWSQAYARPVKCRTGWHVTTPEQAASWAGLRVFVVEVRGVVSTHLNKAVAGQMRLVREIRNAVVKRQCKCGQNGCFTQNVSEAQLTRAVRAHVKAANRG